MRSHFLKSLGFLFKIVELLNRDQVKLPTVALFLRVSGGTHSVFKILY
jgi:hypothetical protein